MRKIKSNLYHWLYDDHTNNIQNIHSFITWLSSVDYLMMICWSSDYLMINERYSLEDDVSYFDFHLMITWRSNHYLFNSDYHTSNICVPFVHYPCHKITVWWSLVNHLFIIQRLSYLYINEDYQLIIWLSLEDLMIPLG